MANETSDRVPITGYSNRLTIVLWSMCRAIFRLSKRLWMQSLYCLLRFPFPSQPHAFTRNHISLSIVMLITSVPLRVSALLSGSSPSDSSRILNCFRSKDPVMYSTIHSPYHPNPVRPITCSTKQICGLSKEIALQVRFCWLRDPTWCHLPFNGYRDICQHSSSTIFPQGHFKQPQKLCTHSGVANIATNFCLFLRLMQPNTSFKAAN